MALTTTGDMLVSETESGRVSLLAADRDGDGRADGYRRLIDGLGFPHGLALADGWLTIAEEGAVRRVRFDEAAGEIDGQIETVVAGLPADGGHFTRTVAYGPDGGLYVTVGSSCNVCIEDNPWRAAMLRLAPGGSQPEIFAEGLRNTVGFDWRPSTGLLYGVDNGRDWLGDDQPPDELNVIVEGGFYGWPFYYGMNEPDPEFGDRAEARNGQQIAPVHAFAAHTAPLSIRFLRHQPDPAWNGVALVGLHGSWNRSSRIGYEVVSLHWSGDGTIEERPFLTGFRDGEEVLGRPVDVIEAPDGTIYVTDDYAGAVYRVSPLP